MFEMIFAINIIILDKIRQILRCLAWYPPVNFRRIEYGIINIIAELMSDIKIPAIIDNIIGNAVKNKLFIAY